MQKKVFTCGVFRKEKSGCDIPRREQIRESSETVDGTGCGQGKGWPPVSTAGVFWGPPALWGLFI